MARRWDCGRPLIAIAVLAVAATAGCITLEDVGEGVQDKLEAPNDTEDDAERSTATDTETEEDKAPETGDLSVSTVAPDGPLAFDQAHAHSGDSGTVHVLGLLANEGDTNVTNVWLEGQYRTAEGETHEITPKHGSRTVVPVGERAPFHLRVRVGEDDVEELQVSARAEATDEGPVGSGLLAIRNVTPEEPSVGDRDELEGEIVNHADQSATNVQVIAAFFDGEGQLQSVSSKLTRPSDIQPGSSVSFEVRQFLGESPFADHQLWVEATEMGGKTDAKMVIESHTSFRDDRGRFHVVGLAQNRGGLNASRVDTEANFYDATGALVNTTFTYGERSTVPSGERTPFHLTVHDEETRIDDYELEISSGSTREEPLGAEALSASEVAMETQPNGTALVDGHVRNEGPRDAGQVRVVVAFYDEEGQIHRVGVAPTDPSSIPAGDRASFAVSSGPTDAAIGGYDLWVAPMRMSR